MWPPSRGSSGRRFSSASERLDEREQLEIDAKVGLDGLARDARDPDRLLGDLAAASPVTSRPNPAPIAFVTNHVLSSEVTTASPGEYRSQLAERAEADRPVRAVVLRRGQVEVLPLPSTVYR